jgi:putative hydrolase of the HAD superfamily
MGTLVKLEPPVEPLRRELELRFGVKVSVSEAERAIAAEITYYRAHMDEGRDPAGVRDLHRRCAETLREALPLSAGLRDVDGEALTKALLASLRFSAFPDASAALSRARDRGQRVIVVSNWDSSLAQVLERVGLASLLDCVITSAGVGARKPAAAMFEAALAAAGVTPAQALHVGDSLEEDVAGARAAGIAALWLNRDGAGAPPGVSMIRSLDELSEN